MKSLKFRTKILLLSIVPFLVISCFVIGVVAYQVQLLGQKNADDFSEKLFDLRRNELKNYSDLAISAVKHITDRESVSNEESSNRAKAILNNLTYGNDGYFFVYDSWINQIIPRSQELKDTESDLNGISVVESFYKNMLAGGGYTDYSGWRPTEGGYVDKIAYSDKLSGWDWWFGTGVYVNDLNRMVENVKNDANENILKTVKVIILLAAIGVFTIGFFSFRWTFSESKLADEKLQNLSLKNVVAQEKERARVSRELHSSVSYKLTQTKNKLGELAKSTVFDGADRKEKENFTIAAKALFDAMTEIRRISGDLRPIVLDHKGLEVAIHELIDKQQQLHKHVNVQFTASNVSSRLTPEIDISLYRILQEALSNVYQHADAKVVNVRLFQQKNKLQLTIRDDGCGFNVKENTGKSNKAGIGLVDMRIRAESLGGYFSIYSSAGIGSHIKVDIPIL